MATHVIWDWNGTLLGDTDVVLQATNAALAKLHSSPPGLIGPGVPPLTAAQYQAAFARPLELFYANIFGREITSEEFLRLHEFFRDSYQERMAACELNRGAHEVLAYLKTQGSTQSLLSLWTHPELLQRIAQFGLTDYFVRVDGRPHTGVEGLDGKTEPLRRHVEYLRTSRETGSQVSDPAPEYVLIGDSLDDAVAARANGVRCVLFASGIHTPAALTATGLPVAHTLHQAVEVAEGLAS
ncbi:MAG: HAD family hydrolase [Mycobacteriales bacterium]